MSRPLPWLPAESERLRRAGLWRRRRAVESLPGGWCRVDGRRLRDFASNDYLGLAHDPRVIAAAREALDSGAGSRASALVIGRTIWQERLERALAEFEGEQAAIVFPSGYAANVGTLCALAGPEDVVFCDRLNHASLVDGCRLSGARLRVYRHDDLSRLERELEKAAGYRRGWIVTDGVFSMDGDAAPLPALCDLAERFGAHVLVDEAHATGLLGEVGRGTAEWQGVAERVAVRVGTLSKAVGTLGGFVVGSADLIEHLHNAARTQMFSTALPPPVCAAAAAAIGIIRDEPARRATVLRSAETLRKLLVEAGLTMPAGGVAAIVPVVVGDADRAMQAAAALEAGGRLVGAIRPPTVPRNTSRLRITLSANHNEADVRELANAVTAAVRRAW